MDKSWETGEKNKKKKGKKEKIETFDILENPCQRLHTTRKRVGLLTNSYC